MVASAVENILQRRGQDGDEELYQSVAMSMTFTAGIVLIALGLLRAGFVVVFLSRPVMVGFIMSVGFVILVNQFRALLGLDIVRTYTRTSDQFRVCAYRAAILRSTCMRRCVQW